MYQFGKGRLVLMSGGGRTGVMSLSVDVAWCSNIWVSAMWWCVRGW